jgi:hypothetical protein
VNAEEDYENVIVERVKRKTNRERVRIKRRTEKTRQG